VVFPRAGTEVPREAAGREPTDPCESGTPPPADGDGTEGTEDTEGTEGLGTDGLGTDGVLTDGALAVGRGTVGTVTLGTVATGVVTDGVVTDGVVTDGVVTDGVVTDGVVTPGAMPLGGTVTEGTVSAAFTRPTGGRPPPRIGTDTSASNARISPQRTPRPTHPPGLGPRRVAAGLPLIAAGIYPTLRNSNRLTDHFLVAPVRSRCPY